MREAWRAGDLGGMMAAVSPRMVEAIAIAGTPEEARRQMEARWNGLYDRVLLWPPAFRGLEGVRAVLDTFGASDSSSPPPGAGTRASPEAQPR